MPKSSDPWSIVVIVLTIALFILALFVKGFTKGLLVECGVLMVSIKLILMAKKTAEIEQNLEQRLDRIEKLLSEEEMEKQTSQLRKPDLAENQRESLNAIRSRKSNSYRWPWRLS